MDSSSLNVSHGQGVKQLKVYITNKEEQSIPQQAIISMHTGGTVTVKTAKIRKVSGQRGTSSNQVQPIQPNRGGIEETGISKERIQRKVGNTSAVKTSMGFTGDMSGISNALASQQKIQAKRNSKMHMATGPVASAAAAHALIAQLRGGAAGNPQINALTEDYQQPLSKYEKPTRRNISKSNNTMSNQYYQRGASSISGYHDTALEDEQQPVIDQDGQQMRVEDYNDNSSLSITYNRRKPQLNIDDADSDYREGARQQQIMHNSDYQDSGDNLDDTNIKIPAFLGRQSLDPGDTASKEQFYLTQVLTQGQLQHLKNIKASHSSQVNTTMIGGSQSSGNLKAKGTATRTTTASKLKGAKSQVSKKTVSSSMIKSQLYNSVGIANPQTVKSGVMNPRAMGFYNQDHQEDQHYSNSTGMNSVMKQRVKNLQQYNSAQHQAPQNGVQSLQQMMTAGGSGVENIGKTQNDNGKEAFNQTAPINMTKIMQFYPHGQKHPHNQDMSSLDSSHFHQQLVMEGSTENLRQQQAYPQSQSYYNVGMHYPTSKSKLSQHGGGHQSQELSLSPVKKGGIGKKQLLIQSILSQEQRKEKQQYLNQTLQQQMNLQPGPQLMLSQELIQQVLRQQQQQQKRLNKTLENLKEHGGFQQDGGNSNIAVEGYRQGAHSSGKLSQIQNNPSNVGVNYSHSKQGSSQQKNKFSSTMRVQSDFNQTQQFVDLKGVIVPVAQSNYNFEPTQQANLMTMGRKSKNSLKSTQNLNLQQVNKEIQEDNRKTSALSIYSTNVAQSTTSYGNKQLTKKASGTKVSQHRKQSSQGDNEREMLKKMMNFYQDDFLNQQMIQKQQVAEGRSSKGGASSTNYSASKSAQKIQANKHKANSTLNQYLMLQQQVQIGGKSGGIIPMKAQAFFNEPPILANTDAQQAYPQYIDTDQDEQYDERQGVQQSHPYKHQQVQIKQSLNSHQYKDFQNKTQPIPKSVLEIAAGNAPGGNLNLSTGTSIAQQQQLQQPQRSKERSTTQIGGVSHTNLIQQQIINTKGNNLKATRKSTNSAAANRNQPTQQQVAQNKPSQIRVVVSQPQQDAEVKPIDSRPRKKAPHMPLILDDEMIVVNNQRDTQDKNFYPQWQNQVEETEGDEAAPDENESESSEGLQRLNRFVLGKQIGQGAYAVVRIATLKKDNKKYAIKVYDKSKLTDTNRQRSVRREIKLLQKMNHQNIVKIYEAFETDDHVYLVMEFIGGGSLHSYLKEKLNRRLEENDAKRIFKQIMTALQYCHRKSIAHRDIKLENILLDEGGNVKLIDFGFSTCIPNDKKIKMFCGTPSYMGPEIVMKEEYAGPPADIWASAVLLYALMNGCFPFRGATDKELYRRIQRGTFIMHNPTVSDSFQALLQRMLNVVADDRPSAEEVLSDPWFNDTPQNATKSSQPDSIADQKRQFKAKILGKIPVEKQKNTVCLNSSQEQLKSIIRAGNTNSTIPPQIGQQQIQQPGNAEFSDYGLQQQNIMKRLNQEAYQAYYNTSGGNFGMSGSATIQNPYYNNFFQNNYVGNNSNQGAQQTGNQVGDNPNGGVYPNCFPNFQIRSSPQKAPQINNPSQNYQQYQNQPTNSNMQQQNHQGTPQVFGSPTGAAFHCNGGLINNNFNIINNIIMNQAPATPQSQPNFVVAGATQGVCLAPGLQPNNGNGSHIEQPMSPLIIEKVIPGIATANQVNPHQQEDEPDVLIEPSDDLDEDIVDSITKLGFNRSQVVNQLLSGGGEGADQSSKIEKLYTKIKEDKLSKTSLQNRPQSLQPHRRPQGKHNNGIFPNFIPSIPEDSSSLKKEELDSIEGGKYAYYDQFNSNDDYNMAIMSSQKSPKAIGYRQQAEHNTLHPLFPIGGGGRQIN